MFIKPYKFFLEKKGFYKSKSMHKKILFWCCKPKLFKAVCLEKNFSKINSLRSRTFWTHRNIRNLRHFRKNICDRILLSDKCF